MKRKSFIGMLGLVGVVLLLSGCINAVRGSGSMESRDFDVEDFNALNIGGSYEVTWRQGDDIAVTVEMQENLFDFLRVSVQGDTLYIDSSRNFNTSRGNRPQIYIYTPYLEMVSFSGAVSANNWDRIVGESFSISGSGAAEVELELEVETLDIDLSGAGDINLSGSAYSADISASGAADISADDLQTSEATIGLSGAGSVDIAVADHLSVNLSGAGRVRYTGNPTVEQSVSGAGRVEQK